MLTITQSGLAAITSAKDGGFKIKLASFKLTEYDVSGFSNSDFINATDLRGTSVFAGAISLIEAAGTSTVRLTLVIPKSIPFTGKLYFREIGIYLDTGELFATGALTPAYEKDNQFAIKIYTVCQANRLGEVVSVAVGEGSSLPLVSRVDQLPAPISSQHNAMAVLDSLTNTYEDTYSAGLAVRSGPGLLHWAFTGHNRIYHGLAKSIVGTNTINLGPTLGGFWLNDEEVVIGQITTGAGAGQSRRMVYHAATESFVTDHDWSSIDQTSMIAIWRDNSIQLPTRNASIPEYYVLGHGLNSWSKQASAASKMYSYTSKSACGTLNSDSQYGKDRKSVV